MQCGTSKRLRIIETVPAERADPDIQVDIRQALRLDPVADANAVAIEVRNHLKVRNGPDFLQP